MLTEVIITSSRLWTIPLDWSNFNTIEIVGAGGGGGSYYRWSGGSRLTYGYGGSGGGYAKIENLNLLLPGESIFITVGAGGSGAPDAGSRGGGPGNPGGSTLFGSYLQASGGQTQSVFPFQLGGTGSISAPVGSYTNFISSAGSTGGLYVGGSPGVGGNSGRPGYGSYGKGGNSQNYYSANYQPGAIASTPGTAGVVRITYTPSGTHQACVWIS